jgi:hypothetical protein|tara:strand:+ start:3138 stop:3374 length:237 start_codon:yes stop_codon:yes gene_type:complete
MFKDSFKRLIKEAEEAPSYSEEQIKVQGRIWDWNIAPMFNAWAEIASEMKNKNDWNHFAKHVLQEVIDYNKVMKDVKK